MAASNAQAAGGRAAGATREDVLAQATADWLACRRIDVLGIAKTCGVGRATIYRWFGSREALIAEAILPVVEHRAADARAAIGGHGARAIVDTLDLVFRGLWGAPHIRAFIEQDRTAAVSLMTSSSGAVHPRLVELVRELIEREAAAGDYRPPVPAGALAHVLVRAAEGIILLNEDARDVPADLDQLRDVCAELLSAPPRYT